MDDAPASPELQRWSDEAALAAKRHLERVAQDGDARQRIVALYLLLMGDGTPDGRQAARETAARLLAEAPDDELLALAQTWFCDPRNAPCTDAEQQAWARLAPDNAAAFTDLLGAYRDDPAAIDAVLARTLRATRYDSQSHALALEVFAAFDGLRLPAPDAAQRRALERAGFDTDEVGLRRVVMSPFVFALPMPGLGGTADACRAPVAPTRLQACRVLFTRMSQASTLIERRFAVSMLAKLLSGFPEGALWAGRKRDMDWQLRSFSRLRLDAVYWDELQRFGEAVAVERALVRAGIPLQAPPGWTPPRI